MPVDILMRSLAAERGGVDRRRPVGHGLGRDGGAQGDPYGGRPDVRAGAVHGGARRDAAERDRGGRGRPHPAAEGIAADLAAIARGAPSPPTERWRAPSAPRGRGGAFRQIVHLLKVRAGVDVSHYKPTTLRRRISRRMALVRAPDEAYLGRLRADPEELSALHDDLFIHVTSFFRDPEVFAALQATVFPTLLEGKAKRRAPEDLGPGLLHRRGGVLARDRHARGPGGPAERRPVQLFATDVSERAVRGASGADFPPDIAEHVSAARLTRFFEPASKGYRIGRRPGGVHLRAPRRDDGSALLADRPPVLPQPPHLLRHPAAEARRPPVPLRAHRARLPGPRPLGDADRVRGDSSGSSTSPTEIYARPRASGRGRRPAAAPDGVERAWSSADLHRRVESSTARSTSCCCPGTCPPRSS